MSSVEKKTEAVEGNIVDKEKGSGDAKSDTVSHKRSASEVNSAEDEVKQKVLKTDRKESDKENGESEDAHKDDDEGEDSKDEDDGGPEGEGDDFDDEDGEGEGDEDGAEDDDGDDDEEEDEA